MIPGNPIYDANPHLYESIFAPTLTVRDRSEDSDYEKDEEYDQDEDLEDLGANGVSPLEDFYLDDQERQEVHINILDMRLSREREQEALDAIPHLVYDPEYVSGFNETFKTGARRVFEQAMAKIHTWAKYGDPMY